MARARGVLASPGSVEPRERIFVREHNSVVPVALADIHRIEGQDDYCMLHSDRNHLVNLRLRDLEAWLPNPPLSGCTGPISLTSTTSSAWRAWMIPVSR